MKRNWRQMLSAFAMTLMIVVCSCFSAMGASPKGTGMVFENGMAQPILQWSDWRSAEYGNEESDILRFCVYVETDGCNVRRDRNAGIRGL